MDKKIVYTVMLGNYKLNEPEYENNDWKFVCFTNQKVSSKNWTIININSNNPRKKAREIKIMYNRYLDFDISLFIDAKFKIKCDLNKFIKKNLKYDISLMNHNRRNCIYDEAKFCIDKNIGNKKNILNQISFYRSKGFPSKFGLYATGILIRRNTPEVIKFMKLWYNEIKEFSYRDQISFPFILWKNPIKFGTMPFKKTYGEFK